MPIGTSLFAKIAVIIPHHDGLVHDEVENTFCFNMQTFGTADLNGVVAQLRAMYNSWVPTWGSSSMAWTAARVKIYDISSHLNGSAGAPLINNLPLGASDVTSSSLSLPQPCALVVSLNAAGRLAASVTGGTGTIPTSDFGQDIGAPATHPGQLRPKERLSGRVYLGPLNSDVLERVTGVGHSVPAAAMRTAVRASMGAMGTNTGVGGELCVWSRRNAAAILLEAVSTADDWGFQRLRSVRPTLKTLSSIAP